MGEPRTTREALIAQILGDLDGLLTRAERLPAAIAEAEQRLVMTTRVLNEASDKYRLAVTSFTEQSKSTLTDYLQQKAVQMASLRSRNNARCCKKPRAVRFGVRHRNASPTPGQTRRRVPAKVGTVYVADYSSMA